MLWKRKWIILAIFLLIAVPWVYNVQKEPPIYRAATTIRFRNLASGTPDVIDEGRITELTSRTFAEDVVAQLGLTLLIDEQLEIFRQDIFDEFVTTKEPTAGMYILRLQQDSTYIINQKVQNKEFEVIRGSVKAAVNALQQTEHGFSFRLAKNLKLLPTEINFDISNFRAAVRDFQNRTGVSPRGGGLLFVQMIDKNPVLVAKKVNRLAEIFVEESKKLKRLTVESQKATLEEQLDFVDKELKQADEELMQFKSRHKVSLSAETDEVVKDLDEAENFLKQQIKNRDDLNDLLNKLDSYQYDPENKNKLKYVYQQIADLSVFSSNPKMGLLKRQLKDAEQEYNMISLTFSPNNEKALKLDNDINLLHQQILKESRQQLTELGEIIDSHSQRKGELSYKLKKLPEEEYTLTELERQLAAKAEIRRELLAKMQLVQLSDAVETEVVDILDPALVPDMPMTSEKRKKMGVGAVLGLVVGIGVAFVLAFFDKAIKTVDDVKRYLKLQVLGTIPHIDFKDLNDYQDSEKIKQIDQQLVTYDYSPTPIGEAYRSLRTNLVYSKNTGRIQSFVVTSAAPADGKSFTSANIAISMAQHKSNTLLVDADLRRGVLHNTYGIPKEPGLTNYLTGMVGLSHVVNNTLIPNLSMITCGSLLPNPSELLGSHQMQRFLDEAKRKFDVIIFDSPPLNAATDAIVLGTQVDALVLVVRSGVTNREVAKQKLELFRNVPVKILGVILNGTSNEFGHDGYSYYHY